MVLARQLGNAPLHVECVMISPPLPSLALHSLRIAHHIPYLTRVFRLSHPTGRANEAVEFQVLMDHLKAMEGGDAPSSQLYDKLNDIYQGSYESSKKKRLELTHLLLSLPKASEDDSANIVERIKSNLGLSVPSYNPPILDSTTVRKDDSIPTTFTIPDLADVFKNGPSDDFTTARYLNMRLARFSENDIRKDEAKWSEFRALARRIQRADAIPDEHLVGLLIADFERADELANSGNRGSTYRSWGDLAIHEKLTVRQLELMMERRPKLLEEPRFLDQYTELLRPLPNTPLDQLPKPIQDEYFKALIKLANRLEENQVLYGVKLYLIVLRAKSQQRLFDFDLLEDFIKYSKSINVSKAGYSDLLCYLRSYGQDAEPVILEYLHRYIRIESSDDKVKKLFGRVMDGSRLNNIIALARVRHGAYDLSHEVKERASSSSGPRGYSLDTSITVSGPIDSEAYAALINKYKKMGSEYEIQRLFEETYLRWAPREDNKQVFEVDEEVVLYGFAKRIDKVSVRLYCIDGEARLKALIDQGRLTQTAADAAGEIDLSGLVPHLETTVSLSQVSPYAETCIKVAIPCLRGRRGEFIVELVSEGISTRALIRKGYIPHLEQVTKQGLVLGIFTEDNKPAKGFVTLNRQTYHSDPKTGLILLPFAEHERDETVVITRTGTLESSPLATSAGSSTAGVLQDAKWIKIEQERLAKGLKPCYFNIEARLEASAVVEGGESKSASLSTTAAIAAEPTQLLPLVLTSPSDRFSTVATISRPAANYQFSAGFHVEREVIAQLTMAKVVISATLTLNGIAMPLSMVDGLQLTLETTDAEDVSSTQTVTGPSLRFNDAGFAVHEFRVPANLRGLGLSLDGKVKVPLTGTTVPVSATRTFAFNDNLTTNHRPGNGKTNYYLYQAANGQCHIFVLGLGGEPVPYCHVDVDIEHLASTKHFKMTLQTDIHGKIIINNTGLVKSIEVQSDLVGQRSWNLQQWSYPKYTRPDELCVEQGAVIRLPYGGNANEITREEFSMTEISETRNRPIRSVLSVAVSLDARTRHIVINTKDLQPGVYKFVCDHTLPSRSFEITLTICKGIRIFDFVLTNDGVLKQLSSKVDRALQITSITGPGVPPSLFSGGQSSIALEDAKISSNDTIRIKLADADEHTRVTVCATYFVPEQALFDIVHLNSRSIRNPLKSTTIIKPHTAFFAPQTLGSEHRYIVQRRSTKAPVGNMLPRPTLLLGKRFVRDTSLDREPTLLKTSKLEQARDSQKEVARKKKVARPMREQEDAYMYTSGKRRGDVSVNPTIEFLAHPGVILPNLVPGADGVVEIPRSSLSEFHSYLTIFAYNIKHPYDFMSASTPIVPRKVPTALLSAEGKRDEAKSSTTTAPAAPAFVTAFRDCRLISSLDTTKHYTEQYLTTCLDRGETLEIPDIQSSRVEVLTNLQAVQRIMLANNSDVTSDFTDFGFLLKWNTLTQSEKEAKFNQYLSHELNVFIYFKDKPFFERVVRPHIKNKIRHTLIDRYLLDEDLSPYSSPEAFSSLNAFEKILLGERLGASEMDAVVNLAMDQTPMRNLARYQTLFMSALRGRELDEPTDNFIQPPEVRSSDQMESYDTFGFAKAEAEEEEFDFAEELSADGDGMIARGAPRGMMKSMRNFMAEGDIDYDDECEVDMCDSAYEDMARKELMPPPAPAPGAPMSTFEEAVNQIASTFTMPRETYRSPETTKEYEERDYHNSSLQNAKNLVRFNDFWVDYASYLSKTPSRSKPFLSSNFLYAITTFTEIVFALAVLDLPLNEATLSAQPKVHCPINQPKMTIEATNPCIVFHKELRLTPVSPSASLSVTQSYFDPEDAIARVDGENVAKTVSQFLPGRVYACRVAVTNIAPFELRCGILLQLPTGSISVHSSDDDAYSSGEEEPTLVLKTRNEFVTLDPYSTTVLTYRFYFPISGQFDHYPAHVCKTTRQGTVILGYAQLNEECGGKLKVTTRLDESSGDSKSWAYYAGKAPLDELLAYLSKENISQIPNFNITQLLWRCKEASTWEAIFKVLGGKRADLPVNFMLYVFKHWKQVDTSVRREALRGVLLANRSISSRYFKVADILQIDIADTWAATAYGKAISHLEYMPLLCSRVHELTVASDSYSGGKVKRADIQNLQLRETYESALRYLLARFRSLETTATSWILTLSYLLLLQERVQEAFNTFSIAKRRLDASPDSVPASSSSELRGQPAMKLQIDYMNVYFKFFQPEIPIEEVRAITSKYKNYPVGFWRTLFSEVENQLREIESGHVDLQALHALANEALESGEFLQDNAEIKDHEVMNRARALDSLALTEPTLDAEMDQPNKRILVTHHNLTKITAKFYPMDIEFLFSSEPFLKGGSDKFANIAANYETVITVPKSYGEIHIPIPKGFENKDLTIQICSESASRVITLNYFACSFAVQVIEAFGQVKVTTRPKGSTDIPMPLPQVYVKCYARMKDGTVDFYKDGYTDHRGRFDYVSVSSDKLKSVERFALLVTSADYGSYVCEAAKPNDN